MGEREDRIARALRRPAGEGDKGLGLAVDLGSLPPQFSWLPTEEDVLRAELLQARQAADAEAVFRITQQLNRLVP